MAHLRPLALVALAAIVAAVIIVPLSTRQVPELPTAPLVFDPDGDLTCS